MVTNTNSAIETRRFDKDSISTVYSVSDDVLHWIKSATAGRMKIGMIHLPSGTVGIENDQVKIERYFHKG